MSHCLQTRENHVNVEKSNFTYWTLSRESHSAALLSLEQVCVEKQLWASVKCVFIKVILMTQLLVFHRYVLVCVCRLLIFVTIKVCSLTGLTLTNINMNLSDQLIDCKTSLALILSHLYTLMYMIFHDVDPWWSI